MKRFFAFLIVAFYVSIAFAAPAWFPEGIQTKGSSTIGEKSTAAASSVLDIRSTTKGLLTPRMTTAQRTAISSPATGLIVYDTDTLTVWQYNGSNWVEVGSGGGGGGRNYIEENPDAELDTSGWVTYADAAGTTPVNGTGGTAASTWDRTTSTPLAGDASFLFTKSAANRQGEGVSFDFTIEPEDRGRMLQIDYSYQIASGTFATGDLAWYIYDVTNSRLIQPSAYQVENVGVQSHAQPLTFQTSIDSTSYRLILHVASTSASAYTAKFDSVKVGPQNQANGPPITSWVSYTPTGSWSTNTTYSGRWRQVGDTAEIQLRVAVSGAPTSATLTVNLPSGMVIDTTKFIQSGASYDEKLPGSSGRILDNGSTYFDADAFYSSTTAVLIKANDATATYTRNIGNVTQIVPMTWASGDEVNVSFRVPIVGWSSSTVVSSSANTRPVVFDAVNATSSHTSSAAKMTGWTVAIDTHGGWDSSNNRYVVKVPGDYRITMSGAIQNTAFATSIYLYRNGSTSRKNSAYSNGSVYATPIVTGTLRLSAGDYIEAYFQTSSGVSTALDAAGNNFFSLEKVDGPAQIAAETEISARYTGAAAGSFSGETTIVYGTKDYDSHNAYNSSTGVFTAPAPGRYFIKAMYLTTAITQSTSGAVQVGYSKNGGARVRMGWTLGTGVSINQFVSGDDTVNLNAGDTITFKANSSATATMDSGYMTIHRLGGLH